MKLAIHSTPVSRGISGVLLVLFVFYAIFTLGMPTLLVSFALGMIVYSMYDSLEVATAVTIILGVILSFTSLTRRVSAGTEGFEDAKKVEEPKKDEPKKSETPATTDKSVEKLTDGPAPAAASALSSGSEAAPLSDANSKGQFKLGEIPKEEKGGFFIDQGTTLMNALNGLKPDQIKSMTSDTKQLLETQKSLMGMLDSLAPMMKESGSLLNMFQNMFGSQAGGATTAA